MGDSSCSTQIIDGDGVYNVSGMFNFMKTVELGECGLSYVVVSIMGPRSSGKSTLLNHLFHTKFKEMDALKGRPQTTKGIWLARCVDIEPCTIIMDLEGSDGRGHGEDDTSFGEQSALFAFSVSDIVLINMWCHDIGREHAANKPLLRTVFQTPVENLEHMLRGDIQKIWDSVQKSLEHINTPLSEFFNVEVVALSSFEEKEEQFKEQVMIAIVRCEEIANAKIDSFLNNEEWCHLEEAVQNGIVPDFAKKLSSILENCLIGYDKEALYFDDSVKTLKRQQLESKLFQYVQPAYRSMLKHLISKYSEDFNVRFNEARKSGGAIAAFNDCSQSVMFAFDEDCKGIQQTIRDSLKVGYAKSVAESKEKEEEAGRAWMHMKDRFSTLCSNYSDSTRKLWMGKEDKKVLHIGSDLSLLNRRSCAKE